VFVFNFFFVFAGEEISTDRTSAAVETPTKLTKLFRP